MKRLLFLCIYGFAALIGANGADQVATPDEIAVYRTLFDGQGPIALEARDAKPAETAPYHSNPDFAASLKKSFPEVNDATIADYQRAGDQPALLTPQSEVGVKLIFFGKETKDEIFRKAKNLDAGWNAFRERFHVGGITYLTKVGFNRDRTQALVVMGYSYASLGAESSTYFLVKRHGRWIMMGKRLDSVA